MVTETDKKLAESMRSLGQAAFDLANEIDPPYPCGPFEGRQVCPGGGGVPAFADHYGKEHTGCEEVCSHYLKWKIRQEE